MKTQSYALTRIATKTWGLGLAKAREGYSKCIRSALAYGASSFHNPTEKGSTVKGIAQDLEKIQNKLIDLFGALR